MADDDAQPDANLAGALADHERIRRSTDLPPFKGYINGKLLVNGKDWLDRFERSAIIAKWNTDERKILEFEQLLRDAADDWWKGLRDYDDLDLKQWATIRSEFLKNFDPKGTAKTICSNFKDLHQKPNELVTTFRDRISKVFRKIEDATPDHMKVTKVEGHGINAAGAKLIHDASYKATLVLVQSQIFVAGLRENLRIRVMESGKINGPIRELVEYARELEDIDKDRKGQIPAIKTIQEDETPSVNAVTSLDTLDEEELKAVNAIRQAKGRPQWNKSGPNGAPKKGLKCRYCQKLGHMQKECRSRARDNAPMVDEHGKPYQARNRTGQFVKAIEDEEDGPDIVGYVSNVSAPASAPNPLNW